MKMTDDLVHKIKRFGIGTDSGTVEEFMNRSDIIDPTLHIAQKDIVEKHRSHVHVFPGSGYSSEPSYVHNHITVRHELYIVHYKQKKEE